jgi:hypothetical protein
VGSAQARASFARLKKIYTRKEVVRKNQLKFVNSERKDFLIIHVKTFSNISLSIKIYF